MEVTHNLAATALMFEANDAAKHDVTFSRISNEWMLENEAEGDIMYSPSLATCLHEMYVRTSVPSNQWTVSDNPY